MAVLEVLKGKSPGQVIAVNTDRTVFGRHPHCQVVLDNAAISRYHAQILESHGAYYVEDLRSRNGTHVNDAIVDGRQELKDKDVLRVCDFEFRFLFQTPVDSKMLKVGDAAGDSKLLVGPRPVLMEDERQRGVTIDDVDEVGKASIQVDEEDRSSIISTIEAVGSSSDMRLAVKPEAKLKAVLDIGKFLARTLNMGQVLDKTLDCLFQIFQQADEGFIMLRDEEKKKLVVKATKTSNKRVDGDDQVHVSMTIVRKAMESSEGILSANALDDTRFRASESLASLRIRSMICAPLITKEAGAIGVIQITTNNATSQFRLEDLDLLISVASQVSLAVENSFLVQQAIHQRDLERDLEFATQVQLGFLPNSRPKIPGYDFFDYYEPAQRVGGDYFDYISLPNGRLAVTVADVAGKGVPAALLMARLYSSVRYHLLSQTDVAAAMTGLNAEISVSGLGHRFITCAVAVIDPATHEVVLVNAGHLPPIRKLSNGKAEPIGITESGMPLGILPDQKFQSSKFSLSPGESWLIFTDGITEAMRSAKELYGTKRLIEYMTSGPTQIDELVNGLIEEVEKFCEGRAQSDDMCVVGIQRLK